MLHPQLGGKAAVDGDRSPIEDRYERVRREAEWRRTWGGGWDPMHLTGHVLAPLQRPEKQAFASAVRADADGAPRAVLLSDTYTGWYGALQHWDGPTRIAGRGLRVDVVCTPVGWLGQFRRSEVTGRWFRGRHSTHMLGN